MTREKQVTSIRSKADRMQKQIDAKLNPACGDQRPTHRRAHMAESMRADGRRLQLIQGTLRSIATAIETDTLPPILSKVNSKKAVETILYCDRYPNPEGWGESYYKTLTRAGISAGRFKQAKTELENLSSRVEEEQEQQAVEIYIAQERMRLQLQKEPGFFVTPEPVVEMIIEALSIEPGETVLEPSAGIGHIAQALPKDRTSVIELNWDRRNWLNKAGFNVVGDDFLIHNKQYDKIAMNPPFENLADIDHVRHAYSLLKPGGRLVAIMSESPFFRTERKAVEFREWLSGVGLSERLPGDAFKMAGTGVQTRIVTVYKPA